MTYNKTNINWSYLSLLEIVSPQLGKYYPAFGIGQYLPNFRETIFATVTSAPVTICVIRGTWPLKRCLC